MRADYVNDEDLNIILRLLTPPNRLISLICLETGLRIGDVVKMRSDGFRQRMTITEQKTKKKKRVYINKTLYDECKAQAGKIYVFEHRTDCTKHRTRQAVYADIKRAARALRLKDNITVHSLRKYYAVEILHRFDLATVRQALNHDNELVTMLYAYADILHQNTTYSVKHRAHK